MAQIIITGWHRGLQKIALTHLVRESCALSMRDAKACTDAVLDGQPVTLTVPDEVQAQHLADCLQALGANAHTL